MAPAVAERGSAVHEVARGRVDELAGELLDVVDPGALIVALGGGRVIDTAKALAAARPSGPERPRVAAIPTTLSAAEMTGGHRRAAGADFALPGVRPAIVVNDPVLRRPSRPRGSPRAPPTHWVTPPRGRRRGARARSRRSPASRKSRVAGSNSSAFASGERARR